MFPDDEGEGGDDELTQASLDADVVFLATGGRFPDALVGGPLATQEGGPVLLAADELPEVTAEEILRLEPSAIVALGGPGAVSDEILTAAADLVGATQERIEGEDRYDTAVAVSQRLTGEGAGADLVYVATGVGWADGVVGAAAAGGEGVPALLVRPGDVPDVVAEELARLDPSTTVILGGPGAVTDRVAEAIEAILAGEGGDELDAEDPDPDTE